MTRSECFEICATGDPTVDSGETSRNPFSRKDAAPSRMDPAGGWADRMVGITRGAHRGSGLAGARAATVGGKAETRVKKKKKKYVDVFVCRYLSERRNGSEIRCYVWVRIELTRRILGEVHK